MANVMIAAGTREVKDRTKKKEDGTPVVVTVPCILIQNGKSDLFITSDTRDDSILALIDGSKAPLAATYRAESAKFRKALANVPKKTATVKAHKGFTAK